MKTTLNLASVLTLGVLLSACGSDDKNNTDDEDKGSENTYTTVTGIDASSTYAYFDLDTNTQLELTDEEAASNTEWDLAFQSTNIILNGDYSGPGEVKAAYAGNNADFRDAQGNAIAEKFTTATPETELEDFTSITGYPADTEFLGDEFTTVFASDFYNYDITTHTVSANDEKVYLLRSADDYFQVRVTDLASAGRSITDFTLGIQQLTNIQGIGDQDLEIVSYELSDEQLVTLPNCDSEGYIDLSVFNYVTSSDDWDLKVVCGSFEIHLGENATAGDIEDANKALAYADSAYEGYYLNEDFSNTVFKHQYKWYDYNLEGNSKIWSQYRVYFVQTPNDTYKLQVTGYYNQVDGEVKSRQISFIYESIEQATETTAAE